MNMITGLLKKFLSGIVISSVLDSFFLTRSIISNIFEIYEKCFLLKGFVQIKQLLLMFMFR